MTRPLALPHHHIRQILDRNASLLILNRRLLLDTYELHDSHIIRRNETHRSEGRPDLQADPQMVTIEITHATETRLLEPDLRTIRRTGFQTFEDFYRDWLRRHRRINPGQAAWLHDFRVAADARYLHRRVHRGYTSNPAESVRGEAQALSRGELEELAVKARERFAEARAMQAAETPLPERVRKLEDAASQGDQMAKRHLFMIGKHLDDADKRKPRKAA